MMVLVIHMEENEFDSEVMYKLFRTVKEILHPTISKKNISDYKIVISEDVLPVRVFYPDKVSDMNHIIIFIHGNGKVTDCMGRYAEICQNMCERTNSLIIAVEYEEKKNGYQEMYQEIHDTVAYLYHGLEINNVKMEKVCLAGDSTGANLILGIHALKEKDWKIQKEILFYPTLSLEYFGKTKYESFAKNKNFNIYLIDHLKEYYTFIAKKKDLEDPLLNPLKREIPKDVPNTLVLAGNVDCLKEEAKEYCDKLGKKGTYVELPFCAHGFLKTDDKELENDIYEEVKSFLG